jgi:hypothetical protein
MCNRFCSVFLLSVKTQREMQWMRAPCKASSLLRGWFSGHHLSFYLISCVLSAVVLAWAYTTGAVHSCHPVAGRGPVLLRGTSAPCRLLVCLVWSSCGVRRLPLLRQHLHQCNDDVPL